MDFPRKLPCEWELHNGPRRGELCGIKSVRRVDGVVLCTNHWSIVVFAAQQRGQKVRVECFY